MSDDNKFSLGDILWEYADYTPPKAGKAKRPAAPPLAPKGATGQPGIDLPPAQAAGPSAHSSTGPGAAARGSTQTAGHPTPAAPSVPTTQTRPGPEADAAPNPKARPVKTSSAPAAKACPGPATPAQRGVRRGR